MIYRTCWAPLVSTQLEHIQHHYIMNAFCALMVSVKRGGGGGGDWFGDYLTNWHVTLVNTMDRCCTLFIPDGKLQYFSSKTLSRNKNWHLPTYDIYIIHMIFSLVPESHYGNKSEAAGRLPVAADVAPCWPSERTQALKEERYAHKDRNTRE